MKPTSTKPKPIVEWDERVIATNPPRTCNHRFQFVEGGECKCRKCGLGLMGVIDIINGRPV